MRSVVLEAVGVWGIVVAAPKSALASLLLLGLCEAGYLGCFAYFLRFLYFLYFLCFFDFLIFRALLALTIGFTLWEIGF